MEIIGKDSSIESSVQPRAEMESNIVSSDTMTESPDTDSSDELTELVAAASSPLVSGSPGVRMEESADAVPVPEVQLEDPSEANTVDRRSRDYNLLPANALMALNRSAPSKDLSNMQIPTGSPIEENETSMSVSTVSVPISAGVNMPVLVHAYAPISPSGQPLGSEQPRPTSDQPRPTYDLQSIISMLSGIDCKMQSVFNDASQRSAEMAEMHDMMGNMLSDVDQEVTARIADLGTQMVEREYHFMSEIESRTLYQQEVMQAYQENLRVQVTRQREEMQKMMQAQVTQQREEIQSQVSQMERRLKDEFFSRIDSFAEVYVLQQLSLALNLV